MRIFKPKRIRDSEREARRRAYREYLESDAWYEKKSEVLAHYGPKCMNCGKTGVEVHVHHKRYAPILGQETLRDFKVLCVPCHKAEHAMKAWLRDAPKRAKRRRKRRKIELKQASRAWNDLG